MTRASVLVGTICMALRNSTPAFPYSPWAKYWFPRSMWLVNRDCAPPQPAKTIALARKAKQTADTRALDIGSTPTASAAGPTPQMLPPEQDAGQAREQVEPDLTAAT